VVSDLTDLAVKLRGRGLVEADLLLHTTGADGIERAEDADTGVGGILGHVEGNLDVRHCTEVVNFIGLYSCKDGN
jgi:hypothetical protein